MQFWLGGVLPAFFCADFLSFCGPWLKLGQGYAYNGLLDQLL